MAGKVNQFEKLCDPLLLIIMSSLPFKEAARTCILSKRWRHLWHATKNIEFNESFFVKDDDSEGNKEIQRRVFINFVSEWIIHFREPVIDNFSLTFSRPGESLLVLNLSVNCIKFALAHNVKVLGLDFSDPAWEEYNLHCHHPESIDLPSDVYQHRALKSLKLFSCKFCVSDLSNLRMLRHLSLGWVGLRPSSLKTLLVNCELLESLSLKRCWGIGVLQIEAESLPLKTLVVDKCDFTENGLIVDAPKLRFLKYAGMLPTFDLTVGHYMEEADLDVGYGGDEFVEPGHIIQQLFCDLYSIKVLTVCSYILQVIPTLQEPVGMEPSLTVVHLTLKTSLHDNEFWGIKFMLNSCSYLEKLTIEVDSKHSRILPGYDPPFRESWSLCTIVYKCIKRSLKVVEIKGFKGDSNEAYLLNYVISYGRVMEKLNIYLSKEVNANGNERPEVYLRRAQSLSQLRKASPRLRILIFS